MESLFHDVRYAVATLRRRPGFVLTALVTLALGIGGSTAVFSVVYGLLFRPLPYPGADRLVRLWEEHPGGQAPVGQRWLSNHTYERWRPHGSTIQDIGAYGRYEYTVMFGDEVARLAGAPVSPQVLGMLGATPLLGRLFGDQDARDGAERVVIISHQLWRERYGMDSSAIGQRLPIDWEPHTIVGVARPDLRFPDSQVLFWVPYVIATVASRPERTMVFTSLGRLAPGQTPVQAETEGTAAARTANRPRSADLFFGKGQPVVVRVRPLADDLTTAVKPALLVLAAAVGLVLLIACSNTANLFLSRGVERQRELAVRAAIGGSPSRLIRHLLTESSVLAIGGGLLGVLLGWGLIALVPLVAPSRLPRLEDVRLDPVVLGFAAVACVFSAVASGLAPAIRAGRIDLSDAFRGADGASTSGFQNLRTRRLRNALIVGESGFAVMLLVAAGLLVQSFIRLIDVDAGYTASGVVAARIQFPRAAPPERVSQFLEQALPRLRAMPGVSAAGAGSMMPLVSMTAISHVSLPAALTGGKPTTGRTLTHVITPGYAEALRLRLRAGRLFRDEDRGAGARAVIVNEEFVRQYLAVPAVGARLGDVYTGDRDTNTEIVGVVGNMLKDGNDRVPQPEIYFVHGSATQRMTGFMNIVVLTSGHPSALAAALRGLAREVDPTAVVERVEPLTSMVATSVEQPRFGAAVMLALAGVAVALASVGLYGVLSYSVTQRRRELGVRSALGARRSVLVALVLREGLWLISAGIVAGLAGAMGLAHLMRGVLFGTNPTDLTTFLVAPAVLMIVGFAACVIPALRAAAVDPAAALR